MMIARTRFNQELITCLSHSWASVCSLKNEECKSVFEDFVRACVKEDYATKFYKTFNSRKPLTRRFFQGDRIAQLEDRVDESLCTRLGSDVSVKVICGSVGAPIGVLLGGAGTTIDKVFVVEEDSIAQVISYSRLLGYLFLDAHRGALFSFPLGRQDGNSRKRAWNH